MNKLSVKPYVYFSTKILIKKARNFNLMEVRTLNLLLETRDLKIKKHPCETPPGIPQKYESVYMTKINCPEFDLVVISRKAKFSLRNILSSEPTYSAWAFYVNPKTGLGKPGFPENPEISDPKQTYLFMENFHYRSSLSKN